MNPENLTHNPTSASLKRMAGDTYWQAMTREYAYTAGVWGDQYADPVLPDPKVEQRRLEALDLGEIE